jgi:hypothetical protein
MTTSTIAGRLSSPPAKGSAPQQVGRQRFPRHTTNLRWRLFLSEGDAGSRDTPPSPSDPSWDWRLPDEYRYEETL